MSEKEFYTVDDIVAATGASKSTIYSKIKQGQLTPFNKEDRFLDGGNYLFTKEEFERAIAMFEKPGLTIRETAELLGQSPQYVRVLFNQGVLEGIKKPYGSRTQIYILEESVEKYLADHGEESQDVHYLDQKGYFLYQPVSVNGIKGRITLLNKDGTGEVELETGEIINLGTEERVQIHPLKRVEEKDYIRKKGSVRFDFPKPKHINHIVYDIICRLFETVGPKNLQIKLHPNLIMVHTKPCTIDIDHHHEEVAMMQSSLKEGRIVKRQQGIVLLSRVTSVSGEITLEEKNMIKSLINMGKYESIVDFVSQAIREKLEREKAY